MTFSYYSRVFTVNHATVKPLGLQIIKRNQKKKHNLLEYDSASSWQSHGLTSHV